MSVVWRVRFPFRPDADASLLTTVPHASIPHPTLKRAASRQLERAKAEEDLDLRALDCMIVIVFSAFYVESATNFLIQQQFVNGSEMVKKLRWGAKARELRQKFPGELNPGSDPWQTVQRAFKIRNSMAHPKFEVVHGTTADPPRDPFLCLATLAEAERVYGSSEMFVGQLFIDVFGSAVGADMESVQIVPKATAPQ